MNGRLVRRVRVAALTTAIGALGLTVAAPQPAAAQAEKTDKTFKQVAHVKVEIKQESGKVVKSNGTVDWGSDGRIELAGDKHKHAVLLKIERTEDAASKVSITLGYDQDGESVIAPYTFDTKVKKREVIQIEGGIAIALQVTPKKVAVDAPPPEETPSEREEKLEIGGDNDDPLGGLE
ncbi:MAG: hypothetical protein AAF721_09075 [Myxococcota bacterium]